VIYLECPNRDMLESWFQLMHEVQCPVAMVVAQSEHAILQVAIDAGVSTYVVFWVSQFQVRYSMSGIQVRYSRSGNFDISTFSDLTDFDHLA
jgi:AmiR/NasT family two-component response regulator